MVGSGGHAHCFVVTDGRLVAYLMFDVDIYPGMMGAWKRGHTKGVACMMVAITSCIARHKNSALLRVDDQSCLSILSVQPR